MAAGHSVRRGETPTCVGSEKSSPLNATNFAVSSISNPVLRFHIRDSPDTDNP